MQFDPVNEQAKPSPLDMVLHQLVCSHLKRTPYFRQLPLPLPPFACCYESVVDPSTKCGRANFPRNLPKLEAEVRGMSVWKRPNILSRRSRPMRIQSLPGSLGRIELYECNFFSSTNALESASYYQAFMVTDLA